MLLAFQTTQHKEEKKDQLLWSALRNGQQKALTDLFVRHHKHLFNYGIKIKPDHDLVKGCIQTLFMNLWERHSHLSSAVSVKAYLLASLRRFVLEEIHRETARTKREQTYLEKKSSDIFTAEELLIREETDLKKRKVLQHALNNLSPRQKEVIYLRFYHGLSNSEITGVMEINNQCVRNLLSDAVRRLRQHAEKLTCARSMREERL